MKSMKSKVAQKSTKPMKSTKSIDKKKLAKLD